MKKRRKESIFLICVIVVILACGMLFYYQKKNNKCVDLTGTDNKWKVSLNINFAYNSIIVIRPYADYYNNSSQVPPSIIHVRILDGEKEDMIKIFLTFKNRRMSWDTIQMTFCQISIKYRTGYDDNRI